MMQTELLENTTLTKIDYNDLDTVQKEESNDIKSIISKYKEQMVVTVKSEKKIKLI